MPAVKQAVSLVANTMDNGWIGRREVANLWLKDAVSQRLRSTLTWPFVL